MLGRTDKDNCRLLWDYVDASSQELTDAFEAIKESDWLKSPILTNTYAEGYLGVDQADSDPTWRCFEEVLSYAAYAQTTALTPAVDLGAAVPMTVALTPAVDLGAAVP